MTITPEMIFILVLAFVMIEGLLALTVYINERRKGGSHDA